MARFVLLISLAIVGCSLGSLVETMPETEMMQTTSTVSQSQMRAIGKSAVKMLQAKGNDDSECRSLADASIDEINGNINAEQNTINGLSDGTECYNEGQGSVDAAQKSLDEANDNADSAARNLEDAQEAPVDMPAYVYSSLNLPSQCGEFFSSGPYQAAKSSVSDAQSAKDSADAAVPPAQKALDDAKAEQTRLENGCLCTAQKNHDAAWSAGNDNVAANQDAWNEAYSVKCVLDSGSNDNCNIPEMPSLVDKPVQAENALGLCTEAPTNAPTPQPTSQPTPQPTKMPTSQPTKAPTNAPAGGNVIGNTVSYSGYSYAALDNTSPNESTMGCQNDYIQLPSGWEVAPYSSGALTNVVEAYPWGTHVMVFSNGDGYGTSAYSKGKWNSGMLSQSGNSYKPNACHLRVLIRKSAAAAIGNSVSYSGANYAALDQTSPNESTMGCQNDYIELPSGWKVAPYSSGVLHSVVEAYPWGTHVMVFSNGDGYGTSAYSKGKWNSGMLSQSGNSYKPNSCHLRVLITDA